MVSAPDQMTSSTPAARSADPGTPGSAAPVRGGMFDILIVSMPDQTPSL
jgi:hypothetical protein